MTTHRVHTVCPWCLRENDRHSGVEKTPADGDVSVCWRCARVALFAVTPSQVALRRPTRDEQKELDADPDVRAAMERAHRGGRPPR